MDLPCTCHKLVYHLAYRPSLASSPTDAQDHRGTHYKRQLEPRGMFGSHFLWGIRDVEHRFEKHSVDFDIGENIRVTRAWKGPGITRFLHHRSRHCRVAVASRD